MVIGGSAVCLAMLERERRLRLQQRESKAVRSARNLAVAALAGVVMNGIEQPLSLRVSRAVTRSCGGVLPVLVRPGWVRVALEVVLLDYGLYLWHVLTHRIPWLWRFHLVHHVDLDLDASTALRFHFGEMLFSVPWRLAQIRLVGASPLAVSIWQTLLFASILFHHSNVRLPLPAERVLRFLIVTPRMHGIHHRPQLSAADSNWSSGLAVWDLLHGTWRWSEDDEGGVGVPGYDRVEQVTLPDCLTLPFRAASPGFVRE